MNNHNQPSCHRCIQVPNQYCDENSDSEVSDTECGICSVQEPLISEATVFWVDCDSCGSGSTRTVHLEATQHNAGLCVHNVQLKNHFSFSGTNFFCLVIVLTPAYAENNFFTPFL